MRELVVRPRAYADLEGTWLYTFEKWGEEQASKYLRQLHGALDLLKDDPERGKNREAIKPGHFSVHVGRHVAFYTLTDAIVGIERVLHDQMDAPRHL